MPLICDGCGQKVPLPEGYRRNKIQCACGVICSVPADARPDAASPAAKTAPALEHEIEGWLLDDEPAPAPRPVKSKKKPPPVRPAPVVADENDEEDSSPYRLEGGEEVPCPKCGFALPPGSVLCVRCGYHLKQRKKITKTYQPIARTWETNFPLSTRVTLFAVLDLFALAAMLFGVLWGGAAVGVFACSFGVFSTMTAFLLGTFDRIELSRDTRGWVRLVKTWRLCFFPRESKAIDVRDYEGILTGQRSEVTVWEFWIFLFLLFFGLIPGLIWWYFAMYKITYQVALTRDHGYPECLVYSGWSKEQMTEIADTLRKATALRSEDG